MEFVFSHFPTPHIGILNHPSLTSNGVESLYVRGGKIDFHRHSVGRQVWGRNYYDSLHGMHSSRQQSLISFSTILNLNFFPYLHNIKFR